MSETADGMNWTDSFKAPSWHSVLLRALKLLVHCAAFWGSVALLPSNSVAPLAWIVVYICGVATLLLTDRLLQRRLSLTTWLKLFVHALLLAAIFFGADFGLEALKGSIKPRAALPAFLHGLELYYLLVPGVTSVTLAGAVGSAL